MRRGRTRGHSAIEFMMAIVILGLAVVPIFGVFSRSRQTTFKSKISYMALHVARERMEEIRQLPFFVLETMGDNEWKQTTGNAFKYTIEERNSRPEVYIDTGSTIVVGGEEVTIGSGYTGLEPTDNSFDYPEEYKRIWTRLRVEEIPRRNYGLDGLPDDIDSHQARVKPVRMKRVTLEYYWQEKGENLDEARLRHFNTISTIIGSHGIE